MLLLLCGIDQDHNDFVMKNHKTSTIHSNSATL